MSKPSRIKIYDKFDGRCAYCGDHLHINKFEIDHVIPKSNFKWHIKNKYKVPEFLKHLTEFDVEHEDNKFPACKKCNRFKDSFNIDLFRHELESQLERAKKYSTNLQRALKWNQVKETPHKIVFYFEKVWNIKES